MKKLPFFFILILIQLFTACEESQLTEELPEMKTLNSLGRFSISIDKDQITLAPEHEKITDPLLYQDDISNFNFNSLFPGTGYSIIIHFYWPPRRLYFHCHY